MDQLQNQLSHQPLKKNEKIKIDKIKYIGLSNENLIKKAFQGLENSSSFIELNENIKQGMKQVNRFNILEEIKVHLDVDDFTDETIVSILCKEKTGLFFGGANLSFGEGQNIGRKTDFNIQIGKYNLLGLGDSFKNQFSIDSRLNFHNDGEWKFPIIKKGDIQWIGKYRDRIPIGNGKIYQELKNGVQLNYSQGNHKIGYEIFHRNIEEIYSSNPEDDTKIPSNIREIIQSSLKSSIFYRYLLDHRFINSGFKIDSLFRYSGFIGDVQSLEYNGNYEIYFPIYKNIKFSWEMDHGINFSISKLLYNDKLFYQKHRGLYNKCFGKRELNQELGGNLLLSSTFKLLFPLKFNEILEYFKSNLQFFIQMTSLETIENYNDLKNIYQESSISMGIGLLFMISNIQLEFNYNYPLRIQNNDFKSFEFGFYIK